MKRYWKLSTEQQEKLQAYVSGKRIEEFGSGDGSLAMTCRELGAVSVIAVDKEGEQTFYGDDQIIAVHCYFANWWKAFSEPRSADKVAIVCWPTTYEGPGLTELCGLFSVVIYIGRNDQGTACGSARFWRYMSTREVMEYIDGPANALVVYGEKTNVRRTLIKEETTAIAGHSCDPFGIF